MSSPSPTPRSKLLGVLIDQSVLLVLIDRTKPLARWAYFGGVLFLLLSFFSFSQNLNIDKNYILRARFKSTPAKLHFKSTTRILRGSFES